jgi:hypothetical protein
MNPPVHVAFRLRMARLMSNVYKDGVGMCRLLGDDSIV